MVVLITAPYQRMKLMTTTAARKYSARPGRKPIHLTAEKVASIYSQPHTPVEITASMAQSGFSSLRKRTSLPGVTLSFKRNRTGYDRGTVTAVYRAPVPAQSRIITDKVLAQVDAGKSVKLGRTSFSDATRLKAQAAKYGIRITNVAPRGTGMADLVATSL
jgi:hypothetical protein